MVKLGKQTAWHLAQCVHQHVQAATVCHADDDLLDATRTGLLDQLIHGCDETFAALQRKTLLAHIFGVQEALQALRSGQTVKYVFLFLNVKIGFGANAFQALLPPALLRLVGQVHVFGTNRSAISFTQSIKKIT